ncbi:hypothetical protein C2G38_2250109, partial [Gigaspora rosea]
PETNFIQSLYTGSWFNSNEEIKKEIIDAFFSEHSKWRSVTDVKRIFPKSSGPLGKEIDCKIEEEFTLLKRKFGKKCEFQKKLKESI